MIFNHKINFEWHIEIIPWELLPIPDTMDPMPIHTTITIFYIIPFSLF